MTDTDPRERLSAFADGALPANATDALIADLAADARLREAWRRYHLIGDVLRGEGAGQGVAERVGAALAAEPALLAPRRLRDRQLPRWLAPAAGLAAAASVGAMAVLLVSRTDVGGGSAPPVAGAASAPQLAIVRSDPIPSTGFGRIENAAVERELQRYLTVHSDYAASGLKGPLPLAPLLVGHEAGR